MLEITGGKWWVRKVVDTSGDHDVATYTVLSRFTWGDQRICEDISNPNDAELICRAAQVLDDNQDMLSRIEELAAKISALTLENEELRRINVEMANRNILKAGCQ